MEQSKACGHVGKAAGRTDGPARNGGHDGGPRSASDGAPGHGPDRVIGGAADGLPGIAAPAAFQMERPAGFWEAGRSPLAFAVYLAFLAWIVPLKGQFSLEVAGTMRSVNLVPLAGATVINGAADYREAVRTCWRSCRSLYLACSGTGCSVAGVAAVAP